MARTRMGGSLAWKTGAVLVVTLLAVVAAVVAIGRLQSEASAARDAELQLIALRLDVAHVQDVPWGASPDEGDDPADVRDELTGMEEAIDARLTALRREGLLPEHARIAKPLHRSIEALREVLELVAHDRGDETGEASSAAAHAAAEVDQGLQGAATRLRARSERSMKQARVGTAAVLLLLFGAFAWCYARVARARRTAEGLAAENRRLLELSQAEALTDALTGMGNRRALMTDLEDLCA